LIKIRSRRSVCDIDGLDALLEELFNIAGNDQSEIKQLAEAVRDPDHAKRNAILLTAMQNVFERFNIVTDQVENLTERIQTNEEQLQDHDTRIRVVETQSVHHSQLYDELG
jgi:hypothetical protein